MAGLPARLAAHRRGMVAPATPGAPGRLSPSTAAAPSRSAVRPGRQPAHGRAHGGRAPTGRRRAPSSGGRTFGPLAGQLDRPDPWCRAGSPHTTAASSALHTAHARLFRGPDVVRDTTVVVVGV